MRKEIFPVVITAMLVLAGGGCSGSVGMDTSAPSIAMPNHTLSKDNVFTIKNVAATADGWVVIRNQINGKPSEVLGYAPVKTGNNANITITINRDDATAQQFVTLYKDTGVIGTFEKLESPTSFVADIKEEPVLGKDGRPTEIIFLTELE